MPRSLNEIIHHGQSLADLTPEQQNEIADLFEDFEPSPNDRARPLPAPLALQLAAMRRAAAEQAVLEAVRLARKNHMSWGNIGKTLGTSGEAVRQRYADLIITFPNGSMDLPSDIVRDTLPGSI